MALLTSLLWLFSFSLLVGIAVAQQNKSHIISLGSKLSPSTHPNSWPLPSGYFAFGFYPQNNGFAVGIWLVSQPENIVVWTANRDDSPVSANSTLELTIDGRLLIRTGQGQERLIANLSFSDPIDSASMLDSGNFVLYGSNSSVVWQSFNFPTDTLLIGQNLSNGDELVSSISNFDHSSGRYLLAMQSDGNLVAYPENSARQLEDAYWNVQLLSYFGYVQLCLDYKGQLYLKDESFTSKINRLVKSSHPTEKKIIIYRATLDADGIFRLYSHHFENSTALTTSTDYCSRSGAKYDCHCYPGFVWINQSEKLLGCTLNFTEDVCRKDIKIYYNITAIENTWWGDFPLSVVPMTRESCTSSCQDDCNCGAVLYAGENCQKYKLPIMYGKRNRNMSATAFFKVILGGSASHGDPAGDKLQSLVSSCTGIKFIEELARGSFGAVYTGNLQGGGKNIAVKRLERVVEESEREFRAEMTAIGRTHRRNWVQLLGFFVEGSRKLLVYEYMKNGSLADVLFKAEIQPVWRERFRIALDVARGILYLHEECEVQIIHCNIKPQNILIDDSWTAKISDFGLAKLLQPSQASTDEGLSEIGGYLAPVWQRNTVISVKADIYSYGVALLEIICCRSNIKIDVPPDEIILSGWVNNCFVAGELDKLVEDEDVDFKTLERTVKVGLWCTQDDPTLRPCMKDVVLMLEGTMEVPVPPAGMEKF
ncbi:G-type lectin S-receptor-like serine/threonine-protein kinase LECRK3 [Hevea brasiliensis]|uniref:G-type lectin S-receptor-like serine/threonine-protein kinase LECRK3 n=1 Tax=Hevea brasiliensis TaxID=3981 RepID=UPI0025E2579E|nr:G-type lectin S-receptor-like serine/threonine-protein kinase LECRK3 [Hevea brasiliensis]